MITKFKLIALVLVVLPTYSWAQTCTDQAAQTTKGKWRPTESKTYIEKGAKGTAALAPTLIAKANQFRTFMEAAYPNPIGCDVRSYASLSEFPNIDFPIGAGYTFEMSLIEYYCDKGTKKIQPNEYTGSSGAEMFANTFELFLDASGTGNGEGKFNINNGSETTIFMLPRSAGTIKGQKVYTINNGKAVLYTHDGKLPFKMITREQFLHALLKKIKAAAPTVNNEMDEMEAYLLQQIKDADKNYTGELRDQMKAELQRGLEEIRKQKQAVGSTSEEFTSEEAMEIENYLKTHSKEDLQKPASVRVTEVFRGFFTEEEEGNFLVIKDNTYMKKTLPAQAAQMILIRWNSNGNTVSNDFLKKFETSFPFDKIQALTDK